MKTTQSPTTAPVMTIGATGVDVDKIVAELQATVDRKMSQGRFLNSRIARAERTNLIHLRDGEDFVTFYLACLRDSVYVDIGDFEIHEQRRFLAKPLILLKKVIWKLLKFYTYHLWSQQNQVNGLIVSSIEAIEERSVRRARGIENRLNMLEKQVAELKAAKGNASHD